MDITPQISVDSFAVQGYGPGYFLVKTNKIYDDIIITPKECSIFSPSNLSNYIKNNNPELIIIGTKKPRKLEIKLPHEIMTPDAACRTYNILLSENRNLLAILYRE